MDQKFTTTTDHNEIRTWVQRHQGRPQIDDFSAGEAGQRMLRIDFPGEADDQFLGDSDKPHNTSWDAFFKEFDDQELSFMYTEHVDKSDPSMSYRFAPREG
jgi:hypothetical protein